MITLDPIAQPLPRVRTWIVRGAKTLPGGALATYHGTAWGRNKEEAKRSHERLLEVDRRIRAAHGSDASDLEVKGYTWDFTPLETN